MSRIDRIEIMLRLAFVLRRMDRLASLDAKDEEDLYQTQDEISRLREKWQELTQELKRERGPSVESATEEFTSQANRTVESHVSLTA